MRRLTLLFFTTPLIGCASTQPTFEGYTAITIIVGLTILCIDLYFKVRKKGNELEMKQQEADNYHNELKKSQYKINRLKKAEQTKNQEISLLRNEIKEEGIRHKKAKEEQIEQITKIMELGKKLSTYIKNNLPIVKWSKKELAVFIRYYNITNPKFAENTVASFDNLTDKQTFFLILKDMGKTEADIQQIMVLGENGLSSCKARLKKKRYD